MGIKILSGGFRKAALIILILCIAGCSFAVIANMGGSRSAMLAQLAIASVAGLLISVVMLLVFSVPLKVLTTPHLKKKTRAEFVLVLEGLLGYSVGEDEVLDREQIDFLQEAANKHFLMDTHLECKQPFRVTIDDLYRHYLQW
jgi:hypothetical protein